MWKLYLLAVAIFSGCTSHPTYNAQMCDRIAREPNAVLPQECVEYNEKDAEKAFNKTKKTIKSKEDLEFNKDQE